MIQQHTYCYLCILSQKGEFSVFLVKMQIFHTTSGIWKNLLLLLVTSEFIISVFLDSYAYTYQELRILGQKTCIFVIFLIKLSFFLPV